MYLALFATAVFVLVLAVGYLPFARRFAYQSVILHRMTSLAGGFLIAAALLIALPEGFELYLHGESTFGDEHSASIVSGCAVLLGFLFMLILEGFGFGHDLHEEHHDYASNHGHDHLNHPTGSAKSLVVGLSLHSIMDGIAIGAAYALGELVLSMQLALVILMHKFPAAFSLSAYSLHERNNRRHSLMDLVLFALTTPLAIVLSSQILSSIDQSILGLMLLFSAGSFIYVATVDVLPSIHIREKSRQTLWLVLCGSVLMVLFSLLIALIAPEITHSH